jgi:predicted SAM-dependent methyltransferase
MRKILNQFPFIRNLLIWIRHQFWTIKTKQHLKSYLSENNSPKLQLGAGQNLLPGWFNTDYFPRQNISFVDVTKPFPIPSGSFNFIFTEHHIEHISYKSAVFMLKEAFRILKPGGVIKITTPDLKNSLMFYLDDNLNNGEFRDHTNEFIYSGFYNAINYIPVDDYFKAHEVNDMFLNYEHKFIYDIESLKRVLEHAGFTNVINCSQKDSAHPGFLNIETHTSNFDRYFTLSVEAEKK